MTPRIARFQWDEANLAHLARHEVSRDEIEWAFRDPFSTLEGGAERCGELRFQMLGEAPDGPILQVIFVIRDGAIRPITAYSAKGKLLAKYKAGRVQ